MNDDGIEDDGGGVVKGTWRVLFSLFIQHDIFVFQTRPTIDFTHPTPVKKCSMRTGGVS